jgi:hypothetical protein
MLMSYNPQGRMFQRKLWTTEVRFSFYLHELRDLSLPIFGLGADYEGVTKNFRTESITK